MSLLSNTSSTVDSQAMADERSFQEDVKFLSSHVETVVLGDDAKGPRVAVVPAYQGRVMTSSAQGDAGTSYGWINYEQVEAGISADAQINVFGGEERFWLGPEGGQFSLFFAPGVEFDFANWQTPALIDTVPFKITSQDDSRVAFQHEAKLKNYSKTEFEMRIEREVVLVSKQAIGSTLGIDATDVACVGYSTTNRITNTGHHNWTKESGLLSIWLLGMYKHGPETTVVVPFRKGSEAELGPIVNDEYFGKVPAERLKVSDGVLFFSGDGTYRSKIGLTPQRSTDICGSYDAARGVLTIVKYNQPGPEVDSYVNSMWEIQDKPFAGDVINAYNDGPAEPGVKPLGPFYELETSSPALELASGQSSEHIQSTFHFEGSTEALNKLAIKLLGVSLATIDASIE